MRHIGTGQGSHSSNIHIQALPSGNYGLELGSKPALATWAGVYFCIIHALLVFRGGV